MKKQKSGWEKKKEKIQAELKILQSGQKTLPGFFASSSTTPIPSDSNDAFEAITDEFSSHINSVDFSISKTSDHISIQSLQTLDNIDDSIKLWQRPATGQEVSFITCTHPIQPSSVKNTVSRGYKRNIDNEQDETVRTWLSFNQKREKYFCSVCICFNGDANNIFVTGCPLDPTGRSHHLHNINRHELSVAHSAALDAFFISKAGKSTRHLLDQGIKTVVDQNRFVLKSIIKAFRTLVMQGLPWRGHRNENATAILEPYLRYGNIQALLKLLITVDPMLNEHLRQLSANEKTSQKCKFGKKSGAVGRGSKITWLSNDTFDALLKVFITQIQKRIISLINKNGVFSIQADSTTDIALCNQMCLVIRTIQKQHQVEIDEYVSYIPLHNVIEERLIDMCEITRGRATNLFTDISNMLDKTNLDWKANCIVHCFDGASVMTKLADHFREATQNKNQHIWCHSHRLSLAVVDHCSLIDHPSIQQLFSMLQNLFNFVNAGYKRCAVFVNTVNGSKHNQGGSRKLAKFLTHKWQGRCKAVTSLIGRFDSEDAEKQVNDGLVVQLISTLDLIAADSDFDVETRGTAFTFLQQVLRKESIILAILYSQMMSHVDDLMAIMQFRDSDYSSVNQLISATLLKLEETGKKFDHFWRYADSYCKVIISILNYFELSCLIAS